MGLYDWQSALKEALRKNKRDAHNRYLQLATVREDGSPANRTVVFRGFTENSSQLCMVTDLRSEKLAEIALQPMGEACWYFTNTREQFRLRGELTADGASDSVQRRATWGNLSDAAKAQFFWPEPGAPLTSTPSDVPAPEPPDTPPNDFVLLLLAAAEVDHLRLRGTPQTRFRSRLVDGLWQATAVNP